MMNKFNINNLNIILNILFVLFLLVGCKDRKAVVLSQIGYDCNCNINLINDSTLYIDYYDENNKLYKRINYQINKEGELLKNGEYIEFYSNLNIKTKGMYNNDIREGDWYYYSEQRNLKKTETYIIDSIYHFGEVVNQIISFNSDLSIDTAQPLSVHRINTLQDTIYDTELFIFTVSLPSPKYSDGMNIILGDYDDYYRLRAGSKADTIKINAFEKTISVKDHQIGLNTVRGIILNYDSINMKIWPHFFAVDYYVNKIAL